MEDEIERGKDQMDTKDQTEEWKVEAVTDFIFLGSKVTVMVTVAMKLKDACSLEENLWQTDY